MNIWNTLTSQRQFFLIAGPCVIEDEHTPIAIAREIKHITDRLNIPFIFKASYRKANRSSLSSFTGIGDEKGLEVLKKIKAELDLPITTDIHSEQEAMLAGEVVDILQIPAFLCRQTSLLLAAAKTGKIVNIKKGQFMSPSSMKNAVDKVKTVNDQIMLTERGTTFGYQDLVVDFRSIPTMKTDNAIPVIMDCTHALQRPNQATGVTGGTPAMIETMVRAAIAVGADGLFIETHSNPSEAKSDASTMLPLNQLESILTIAQRIYEASRS